MKLTTKIAAAGVGAAALVPIGIGTAAFASDSGGDTSTPTGYEGEPNADLPQTTQMDLSDLPPGFLDDFDPELLEGLEGSLFASPTSYEGEVDPDLPETMAFEMLDDGTVVPVR